MVSHFFYTPVLNNIYILIYKLISPTTSNVSYLLGTMHVADNRAFAFVALAKKLMKECSLYIGEMNLGTVDVDLVRQAFTLDDNQKYSTVFSSKKFTKYKNILQKSFGINLETHDNIAPIFLQSVIVSKILRNEHSQTLDQFLYATAIAFNMNTDGLESSQEQYDIAKQLDIKTQMKQFTSLCRNPAKFKQQIEHLCDLYQNGDDRQLYLTSKKSLGSFRRIMLNYRNPIMAERILEKIKSESCFVTFGAGHLMGNIGIVAFLKKAGVKVSRVY